MGKLSDFLMEVAVFFYLVFKAFCSRNPFERMAARDCLQFLFASPVLL